MALVTMTTDFGARDWFVGTMKGVMLSVSGRIRVVDITHDVPPGDIMAGAFALASSYHFFPPGTIHLAVVDPGVGSDRAAIVVQTGGFFFVGPDNGVLSLALAQEDIVAMHRIENEGLFFQPVSKTFHGRDIFAPVAARLARDTKIHEVGPAVQHFTRLSWPTTEIQGDRLIGQVIYIDQFGNAITNIPASTLEKANPPYSSLLLDGGNVVPLRGYYQEAPTGQGVAVAGSTDYLEIAVNQGNAAQQFQLKVGSPVCLQR